MQINITDPYIVKKLIDEVNSPSNKQRKIEEYGSYNMYEGKLLIHVKKKLQEMFPETWKFYLYSDYNLHKKMTDKKSKAYKDAPIRLLENQAENEFYNTIVKNGKLNVAMKKIDQMFNRHKYCALMLTREKSQEITKDKFNFIPLAPYEFDVVFDALGNDVCWILSYPDLSTAIGSVSYTEQTMIATDGAVEGESEVYALWTKENHVVYKVNKTKEGKISQLIVVTVSTNPLYINPYGAIPFVFIPESVNGNYPMSSTNPNKTIELNTLVSIYLTSASMQIGQMTIKYPANAEIEHVPHGLMTAIKLPQSQKADDPSTDAQYISPNGDLSGQKEAIYTFLQMILDENGIETNSVVNPNQNFASGFDRLLSNASVQTIIEENQDIYSDVENRIYKIIVEMYKADRTFTFTDENLTTSFKKPKILLSDKEILDNTKTKLELGLIEEWEKFKELDPNITDEQAKQKFERIEAEKQKKRETLMTSLTNNSNANDNQDQENNNDDLEVDNNGV